MKWLIATVVVVFLGATLEAGPTKEQLKKLYLEYKAAKEKNQQNENPADGSSGTANIASPTPPTSPAQTTIHRTGVHISPQVLSPDQQQRLAQLLETADHPSTKNQPAKKRGDDCMVHQLIELGKTAAREQQFDYAVAYLKKAVELDPDNIEARYCLSIAYMHTERKNLAVQEYEEIKRIVAAHEALAERLLKYIQPVKEKPQNMFK